MSTRAVYGFVENKDQGGKTHWIYKHHDGYPEGAASHIVKALPFAWTLPRFEADEFAAAFVAGNKDSHKARDSFGGGGIRTTDGPDSHGDIEYVYIVFQSEKNNQLCIKAYKADMWSSISENHFFYGRLKDFIAEYGDIDAKGIWNDFGPVSSHPIPLTPRKPKKEVCPCCGKEM